MHEPIDHRRAGVLLHISSLPGARIDDDALRWLDFMADCGLSVWQVLPMVIPDAGGSPYQSASAFATDPALLPHLDAPILESEFDAYCAQQAHWLDDFALFLVLRRRFDNAAWVRWPDAYRLRDPHSLRLVAEREDSAIRLIKRQQYQLDRAWQKTRRHAADLGIALFGDLPIFVAHDSADTWASPASFLLDAQGRPTHVTGVPPDYFAESGQRWGNPHYRWERMQADGFDWWIRRMQRQFDLFDLVRVDHFRGLVAVWMIEATCETAVDGYWQETPGDALLAALQQRFNGLPIVAEDLGIITEEVRELRRKYQLPGMAVLQFAFDHFADNPHKPANITPDNVVYTGTHDNDTCRGWFNKLSADERDFVFRILEVKPRDDIATLMLETAFNTPAKLAMAPLQDLLGLDSSARMNTPGTTEGNWAWRLDWKMLDAKLPEQIRSMMHDSGRSHGR